MIRVENASTRIGFDEEGCSLSSIADLRSGFQWLGESKERWLWSLSGIDHDGNKAIIRSSETEASLNAEHGIIEFRGPNSLRITVAIECKDRYYIQLRIRVEDSRDLASIEWLEFPTISGLIEGSYLAFPIEQGILVRRPKETIFTNADAKFRLTATYPGTLSMQFIAYGETGGPGLYLATHDPDGHAKRFSVGASSDGGIRFSVENRFADPRNPWKIPYPAAIGTYQGTWLSAAKIYRRWALKQHWCRKGKLHEGVVPQWLRSNPAWIWNRGKAKNVVPGAIRLSKYLGSPVALDWYWWHDNPYDTMLPDYFPPRDGPEGFTKAIEKLHDEGIRGIAYINGRLCDIRSEDWKPNEAVLEESREITSEVYCKYTKARLGVMCPSTEYWNAKLAGIVSELIEYGLDGVYIDQISSAPPRFCYSESHGHPPGGSVAWAKGYRSILQRVRHQTKTKNPEAMLCSEGCCEVYMDLLDGFLTLSPSYERMGLFRSYGDAWEPIPLFNSVYHQSVITFGSYSSMAEPPYDELWPPRGMVDKTDFVKFADQFDMEIARCLVFGQTPMVANFHGNQLDQPRMAKSLGFLRKACILHGSLSEYLTDGEYVGLFSLDVPMVPVACISKGIYTLPGEARTFTRRAPAVLNSSWKASDGSVATVLANHSSQPHSLGLGHLGVRPGEALLVEPGGREPTVVNGSIRIENKHALALIRRG